ncbi:MAG: response regulator transcription factor [Tepidisphaeraceae bacterium]|jgi:DNA-binding NarL/FixJ family response regulator
MSKTTPAKAASAKPGPAKSSEPAPAKRKIFLVDDHPIVRQGLAQLINGEEDLIVIGQGEDAYQSLRAIRESQPHLVLVDVSLKDSDGIELLKELKAQSPDLPVLVVSMHDESLYAERALRAGAGGYVMKQESPETLLAAIRTVLAGEVYVSGKMGATLLQHMVRGRKRGGGLPMDRLTDRELEIFRMIGAGRSVKEIADKLFLSIKTVEAHREHIKEKLNIKSSAELLRFAIRNTPDAK